MPNYFKKDLISYDECTNAVVSNNLYRDAFPPRLRLNSLTDEYQGWKEGPDWQHIPPLFLYVPLPFYYLDGELSIETRRLSYVWMALMQSLIFIIGIALLFKEKRAILIAALAAYLWTITPFTRGVLNGNYFGYSDIVLSFSVTLSLLLSIGLFQNIRRNNAIKGHLLALAITAATIPLLVKNVLGALPLLFLMVILIKGVRAQRIKTQEILLALFIPIVLCLLYYGASYWKSPEAFKAEFFVSFYHFGNYEGWKEPWHYFVSYYLPNRYFYFMWWPFVIGFFASLSLWSQLKKEKQKAVLTFFLLYFIGNLLAVSIVTSKSPNFILQGYLFILFFVLYLLWDKIIETIPELKFTLLIEKLYEFRWSIGIVTFSLAMVMIAGNIYKMKLLRNESYNYATQNERFYEFGERCHDVLYADIRSLFILDTDSLSYADSLVWKDPDYWMRYYILFHSGSEARRLEEIKAFNEEFDVYSTIKKKYNKVYLVTSPALLQSKYINSSKGFDRIGHYQVKIIRNEEIKALL
ncbi:MAG: hypothetical protein R2730_12725 [Chitinophagales bacterium]